MGRPGGILSAWRARRAADADVAAFPAEGLRGPGLTRADPAAAARMDAERVARMTAMAEVHRLPRGVPAADPRIGNHVARACARCPDDAACRAAFDRPGGPGPARSAFCPNAGTFRALAAHPG